MNSRCPGPIPARTRPSRAVAGVVALGALAVSALTGCSVFSSASEVPHGGKGGRLAVVASFYPLQFLAEQIGRDRVRVTNLTEPGQEPHDLEISARQIARLERSDVALYLKGLQPSVDEAIQQSTVPAKVDATALTTLEKHGNEVGGHAAAHDERPAEEGGTGARDPHIWLDPVRYAEVARGVGKAFEKADPDHAAGYRKNTDALVRRLTALHTRYTESLTDAPRKVFITTHAAFGYLAERYGLTEEAISGLDPESEPGPGRVRDLQLMAKADGVTTVFYETLVSGKTAKTLAEDAHLRTDVLDPVEGITDASRGDDYVAVMDANRTALERALGTPPKPAGGYSDSSSDSGSSSGAEEEEETR